VPSQAREDVWTAFSALPPRTGPTQPHHALTRAELRDAVFSAGPDKAPGDDDITNRVLREGWGVIEEPLFALASACFDEGWFPASLRHAVLTVMRKPGKRDPALPRSYRLIAPLPVVGKAIEKAAATRLSWYAASLNLVPPDQFGAMPSKFTSDAALSLVHDIHEGWSRPPRTHRLTTSVLTFDVVGAFDNANPACYVRLLWQLGLPAPLVGLIASWLHERTARIKLDGSAGEDFELRSGFPQGSPLSPISFVLYLGPLWKELPVGVRLLGYMDDGALMVQSESIEENCRQLEQAYAAALGWARGVDLWFDENKRELIHFPPPTNARSRRPELLPVCLGPEAADTVQATGWDSSVRWLGIWFNPLLNWSQHVRTKCTTARGAVACLKMLANAIRGPSALLMRRAFVACILPILTYACAAWWRGLMRDIRLLRDRTRSVKVSGAVGLATSADLVQNMAMRIILPVWRTTPIAALQCEASLPPIRLILDYMRLRYAIRLKILPANHPLVARDIDRRSPRPLRYSSPLLDIARLSRAWRYDVLSLLLLGMRGPRRRRP